jgi:hypothetical protein
MNGNVKYKKRKWFRSSYLSICTEPNLRFATIYNIKQTRQIADLAELIKCTNLP